MANNITFDFNSANAVAVKIIELSEEVKSTKNDLDSYTETVTNKWKGADNAAYTNEINKESIYMNKYSEMLLSIGNLLKNQIARKKELIDNLAATAAVRDGATVAGVGATAAVASAGASGVESPAIEENSPIGGDSTTTPGNGSSASPQTPTSISPSYGDTPISSGDSKYYDGNGNYNSPVFSPNATDVGVSACRLSTNNQQYQIVDQVTGAGQMTEEEYNRIISVVCQESGSTNPQEMLGIASTILNRYENGSYGNSIKNVLLSPNQFANGGKYRVGGDFYNTDWGQEKIAAAKAVVDDALNGYRNLGSDFYWYAAKNGVTRFRDSFN